MRPLPAPRHAAQRAAGVAASHRALDGPIRPIDAARTHPVAISTGAVAVFGAFRHRMAAAARLGSDAQRQQIAHLISIYDCVYLKFIDVVFARASRCAPRRLAERDHRLLIKLVLLGSIPDACQPGGPALFFTSDQGAAFLTTILDRRSLCADS